MIDVAIVGASGYAALELIRILLRHPGARVAVATSRADEAPRLDAIHPSLTGRIDLSCSTFDPAQIAQTCPFAFLALPHAASLASAPELRRRGVRVIDLSADYRLKDPLIYADWYDHEHTDPAGLAEAVYGLPELFREAIPAAGLIANPGCYTSASILGLAPLLAESKIEPTRIIIDAKSGVSGAGRARSFRPCSPSATKVCPPTGLADIAIPPKLTRFSPRWPDKASKSSSPPISSRWTGESWRPCTPTPRPGRSSSMT